MAGLRPGHPRLSCLDAAKTWVPGIADKVTQSAPARLLWPGMRNSTRPDGLERDEIRLGPFFCPGRSAARVLRAGGSTLLCMGLFSRFFVQALPCTAEGTLCRVRDTRSLVPRAYGTNRSNSNTSCSISPAAPRTP